MLRQYIIGKLFILFGLSAQFIDVYVRFCDGFASSFDALPPSHAAVLGQIASHDSAEVLEVKTTSAFEVSAISWLENRSINPVASQPPSSGLTSQLLTITTHDAESTVSWSDRILNTKKYKSSKVKRVIDSSTIALEQGGYVALDTVRGAGSTYRLPECIDRGPSYKLKQLLPRGTRIRLVNLDDLAEKQRRSTTSTATTPRVWIVRDEDGMLINQELVRYGFAFVRKGTDSALPNMMIDLKQLEVAAKEKGLGVFKSCSADGSGGILVPDYDKPTNDNGSAQAMATSENFVAEFEPMDYTDDGGKTIIFSRKKTPNATPPPNPGDTKGCSDFQSYEDALGWYETYAPYYGDVARLDRDGDGVPCPGLPHTAIADKYRMKVPNSAKK